MSRLRDRLPHVDPGRVDVAIGVLLVLDGLLEGLLVTGTKSVHPAVTTIALTLFGAPVAVRRRWPAGALLASAAIVAVAGPFGGLGSGSAGPEGGVLAPILLGYGAGAWLATRRSISAIFSGAVLLALSFYLADVANGARADVGGDVLGSVPLLIAPWFIGRIVRERGRRADAFRALAAQARATRLETGLAAVMAERARIGVELQDVVAHSVSAMVVHAGGARRLIASDPGRARESILTVEQTGREALGDLRGLLGILRKDGDPRELAPQPGLDRLPDLVDTLAGISVELRTEGEPVDLTPGVDLVGYRVVEAALGHVAARSPGRASVTVRYLGRRLELEVAGDSLDEVGASMREVTARVELYGGSVDIVTLEGDELAVVCQLPLEVAVAA